MPTVQSAVLPAATPESATDFLGLTAEELIELLFVGVVADDVVEFLARLHFRDQAFLRALPADRFISAQRGLVHGAKGGERVQHDADPGRAQLVDGDRK